MTDTNKTEAPERVFLRVVDGLVPGALLPGQTYPADEIREEYVHADLSRPAPVTVKPDARCIIVFADDSVPDAHIDNVEDAKRTLEKMRDNWTCRMFVDYEALAPSPQLTEQEKQIKALQNALRSCAHGGLTTMEKGRIARAALRALSQQEK